MSKPFDATLKEIFCQAPADWRLPFQLPSIKPIRSLNVDLSTLSLATDVAVGFGDPLCEIVDINFQSGPDPAVSARLLTYNATLHLRFDVPVRSILVLLRPKADSKKLTGITSYESGGRLTFSYEVFRLWKQPVELFLGGGIGLLPLATLCKMPVGKPTKQAIKEVVREIDRRLVALPDHAHAARLMAASYILTGLRLPKESLPRLFEGVKVMHQTSAYDSYILEDRQMILHSLAKKRFGDPDSRIGKCLKGIEDTERLKRMIDAVLDVASWKALLNVK